MRVIDVASVRREGLVGETWFIGEEISLVSIFLLQGGYLHVGALAEYFLGFLIVRDLVVHFLINQ